MLSRIFLFLAFSELVHTHIASAAINLWCITNYLKNLRTSWVSRWTMFWLIQSELSWVSSCALGCRFFGLALGWVLVCPLVLFHTERSRYLGPVITAKGRSSKGLLRHISSFCSHHCFSYPIGQNKSNDQTQSQGAGKYTPPLKGGRKVTWQRQEHIILMPRWVKSWRPLSQSTTAFFSKS